MDADPAERRLFQFSLQTVLGFALACGAWLVLASNLDPALRKKTVIYVLLPGTILPALALCYSRPIWSILLVLYCGWIIGSNGAIQSSEEGKALRAREDALCKLAAQMHRYFLAHGGYPSNPEHVDVERLLFSAGLQSAAHDGHPLFWQKLGERYYLIDTGADSTPGHPAPAERAKKDSNNDGIDDRLDDAVFSWDPKKGVE